MFFLARCIFCIGLVAFLLPGSERIDVWKGLAQSATATASSVLPSLCSAAAACAEAKLARLIISGGGMTTGTMKGSVSTLMPDDLVPAWNGAAHRS